MKKNTILFNYHTHTTRCNHACGEDREYVECAIQRGMKTLGFADHAPYVFPDKNYYSNHRMATDALFPYAESVRALAKEYANDIRILLGFELEYYPDYHEEEMTFLRQVQPDYLLLGQHYIGAEINSPYMRCVQNEDVLSAYVTQTIAGLATGDFLYIAHPDLPAGKVTPEVANREFRRLCEYAFKKNIPLEFNLLGFSTNRTYPSVDFFKIASEVGNAVLLGVDAHSPQELLDIDTQNRAIQTLSDLGLRIIDKPIL